MKVYRVNFDRRFVKLLYCLRYVNCDKQNNNYLYDHYCCLLYYSNILRLLNIYCYTVNGFFSCVYYL